MIGRQKRRMNLNIIIALLLFCCLLMPSYALYPFFLFLCYTVPMKKIGILGGTFNPVHNGHLALANMALKEFKLDQIVFIPSGNPPHKQLSNIIDTKSRYQMLKMAIVGQSKFKISKIEMQVTGPAYAVDTFRKLAKKYGQRSKLFYIMGMDSFIDMKNWKTPKELFKYCDLIVATRSGVKKRSPLLKLFGDKICFMTLRENISATNLRTKLKDGKSIAKFVPSKVKNYILQKELYKK